MAIFVVYSYQFSPLFEESPGLFPEYNLDREQIWEQKQEYFKRVFSDQLIFRYRGAIFNHEMLYNENNLIVFRIANNKQIVQESAFVTKKLKHNPSCRVLVDNRKDVQNIYIEKNEYSFSDTGVVRKILEKTFNSMLKNVGLHITIQKRYKASEFWSIVESAENGIEMVRFSILYPNLPSVRARINEMLSETSRELQSKETRIEFNAGTGESLNLSRDNEKVNDLVQASADTGNNIYLKMNGFRKFKKVGETSETVEIDNLEASLSPDLMASSSQKLVTIINKFKA